MSTPTEDTPPEAKLIAERREAIKPKLSQNAAAKLIGLSGNRWRQIEKGYQTVKAGERSAVIAPADTLARMAQVVGVTPTELQKVGRADAAAALNTLPAIVRPPNEGSVDPVDEEATDEDSDDTPTTRVDLYQAANYARDMAALVARIDSAATDMDSHSRTLLTRAQVGTIGFLYSLVAGSSDVDAAVSVARDVARQFGGDDLYRKGIDVALDAIAQVSRRHYVRVTGREVAGWVDDGEINDGAIDVRMPGGKGRVVMSFVGDAINHVELHDGSDDATDVAKHDQAEAQLLNEALTEQYVEMYLRALDQQGRAELVAQAREVLGDLDPNVAIPPEIDDALYAQYIAARHSGPIQGGDIKVHAAMSLNDEQRENATLRYRRERSEMILFDGHIRTAGLAADRIAEAIHRVAPVGYRIGQSVQGDAGNEEDQDAER